MPASTLLQETMWSDWTTAPITGDASTRAYFRLTKAGYDPLILMLDPPHDGNGTLEFERIATHLTLHELSAPEILFHDPASGRMIISDLGRTDIAAWLQINRDEERAIYSQVVDLLGVLAKIPAPDGVIKMTHGRAAEMTNLAAVHYAKAPHLSGPLEDLVYRAFNDHVDPTLRFALRDFHAENLIWRPELSGEAQIGLLDFQDACLAPAGYDLMSLLRDARRDVTPEVAIAMIQRFQSQSGGPTGAHLACVGAQRNLRILGIFARLATDGKPQYLQLVPRVWTQLMIDLAHPALHDLAQWVDANLPKPEET